MSEAAVRFGDGASYEAMMGPWSRSVGEIFLEWMRPGAGLRWLDVGCGSGAFTALVVESCAPATILGIDPSEPQLRYARGRGLGSVARFEPGDAMALSLPDAAVDIAAATLVVHFMPDPQRGIAEMARVTRPGGIVAAYAWDLAQGGFPYEPLIDEMRALGFAPSEPPHPEAAEAGALRRLWATAGLERIAQREIAVTRRFADFDAYWGAAISSPRMRLILEGAPQQVLAELKGRLQAALRPASDGAIVPVARANAIYGRVPGEPDQR